MQQELLARLNGVFAVIKPIGLTSAELCNKIRADLLKEMGLPTSTRKRYIKIGHGGTLDKGAWGVIAVGVGSGCVSLTPLLQGNKKYQCVGKLGIATNKYNHEGVIIQRAPYSHVTAGMMMKTIHHFTGSIKQKPPVFSALKRKGKRLSDLAYAGQTVSDISPRQVCIHHIELGSFNPPYFTLSVHCGGGVYIRSLVHDLGQAVDSCAHVVSLQRSQHGPFCMVHSIPPDEWTIDMVLSSIAKTKYLSSIPIDSQFQVH